MHSVAKFQEKIEGGLFGDLEKYSKEKQKTIILNSLMVLKNLKEGTHWNFFPLVQLQRLKIHEGRTLLEY